MINIPSLGTRERHLESILQSTLRQIVLVHNFPRTLIQITLQITSTPGNDNVGSKLVQASSVGLPGVIRKKTYAHAHASPEYTFATIPTPNFRFGFALCILASLQDSNLGSTCCIFRRGLKCAHQEPDPSTATRRQIGACSGIYISRRTYTHRKRRLFYYEGVGKRIRHWKAPML